MSASHYQLPESTDASVRRMLIALSLFFVSLVTIAGLVFYYAQAIAQLIPFSAEQRFVRPYEKLVSHVFASDTGDSRVTDYLQELSDKLQNSMQMADDIDIKVHYIALSEANAFTTLGGHVFVTEGLLDSMPDENSLAMVLAHEIAHVAHRDPIAGVSRGLALQMVVGFITGGGSNTEDMVDLLGGSGIALFSRDQERIADIAALHALNVNYGHVGGYRTFFEKVLEIEVTEKATGKGEQNHPGGTYPSSWLASHPATEERLRNLDQERDRINATIGENVALPQAILDQTGLTEDETN